MPEGDMPPEVEVEGGGEQQGNFFQRIPKWAWIVGALAAGVIVYFVFFRGSSSSSNMASVIGPPAGGGGGTIGGGDDGSGTTPTVTLSPAEALQKWINDIVAKATTQYPGISQSQARFFAEQYAKGNSFFGPLWDKMLALFQATPPPTTVTATSPWAPNSNSNWLANAQYFFSSGLSSTTIQELQAWASQGPTSISYLSDEAWQELQKLTAILGGPPTANYKAAGSVTPTPAADWYDKMVSWYDAFVANKKRAPTQYEWTQAFQTTTGIGGLRGWWLGMEMWLKGKQYVQTTGKRATPEMQTTWINEIWQRLFGQGQMPQPQPTASANPGL